LSFLSDSDTFHVLVKNQPDGIGHFETVAAHAVKLLWESIFAVAIPGCAASRPGFFKRISSRESDVSQSNA